MKFSIENLIVVVSLVLTEAWFLSEYFVNKPEFEPAIAFIASLGVLFAKDPIKKKFGFGIDSQRDRAKINRVTL